MWQRKQRRPPSTYEDVRNVAMVLSRINVALVAKHFIVGPVTAQDFMERLVGERLFGGLQPDGWHYPPVRKLRRRRTPRKPKTADDLKIDEGTVDRPESVDDL